MTTDNRLLEEYPFDGVFYEIQTNMSGGLLNQKTEEVEILRTKCDIQQTSQIGNAGFLASSYTIYFPLADKTPTETINAATFEDVKIKRGMYFRGMIYGYEVNGKVIGVAPSMLGGCACQIKDVDE